MTQEDKDLLLKDLCARLLYGVICQMEDKLIINDSLHYDYVLSERHIELFRKHKGFYIKPYLRSMSSMTEEEYIYFMSIRGMNLRSYEIQEMMSENFSHPNMIAIVNTLGRYSHKIDWLNENMFDYRGLIPKGLAIEVTKENNPYKD